MRDFASKDDFILFRELGEGFKGGGVLSDKSTLLELLLEMAETMVFSKLCSVSHQLVMGDPAEGIGQFDVDICIVDVLDLPVRVDGDGLLLLEGPLLVFCGHGGRRCEGWSEGGG